MDTGCLLPYNKYHPVHTHPSNSQTLTVQETLTTPLHEQPPPYNRTTAIQNSAVQLNTYKQADKPRHRQNSQIVPNLPSQAGKLGLS